MSAISRDVLAPSLRARKTLAIWLFGFRLNAAIEYGGYGRLND